MMNSLRRSTQRKVPVATIINATHFLLIRHPVSLRQLTSECQIKFVSRFDVCVLLPPEQVGEVQYGGKITDDLDRRLFKAYTETWMGLAALSSAFCFNPGVPTQGAYHFKYSIPDSQEVRLRCSLRGYWNKAEPQQQARFDHATQLYISRSISR